MLLATGSRAGWPMAVGPCSRVQIFWESTVSSLQSLLGGWLPLVRLRGAQELLYLGPASLPLLVSSQLTVSVPVLPACSPPNTCRFMALHLFSGSCPHTHPTACCTRSSPRKPKHPTTLQNLPRHSPHICPLWFLAPVVSHTVQTSIQITCKSCVCVFTYFSCLPIYLCTQLSSYRTLTLRSGMYPFGMHQHILETNNLVTERLSSKRGPHPLLKAEDHGIPLQMVLSLNPLLQALQFSKIL